MTNFHHDLINSDMSPSISTRRAETCPQGEQEDDRIHTARQEEPQRRDRDVAANDKSRGLPGVPCPSRPRGTLQTEKENEDKLFKGQRRGLDIRLKQLLKA